MKAYGFTHARPANDVSGPLDVIGVDRSAVGNVVLHVGRPITDDESGAPNGWERTGACIVLTPDEWKSLVRDEVHPIGALRLGCTCTVRTYEASVYGGRSFDGKVSRIETGGFTLDISGPNAPRHFEWVDVKSVDPF